MSQAPTSSASHLAPTDAGGSGPAAGGTRAPAPAAGGRRRLGSDPLPPSVFSPEVAKTLDRLFNSYMANFTGGA